MYDRLSELSLSIGRDQNGLARRESMERANCGHHPLIHTIGPEDPGTECGS